jgi:hypothetical protein
MNRPTAGVRQANVLANWLLYAAGFASSAFTLLTTGIWLIATSKLKTMCDSFAVDSSAAFCSAERLTSIQTKCGLSAVAAAALTLAFWRFRRSLHPLLSAFLDELARDVRAWAVLLPARVRSIPGRYVGTLLGLITLAVAVRLTFLGREIYYDEAFTYLTYASKRWFIGLSDYSEPNNHLLHTLLVHFSALLLGTSEVALRIPAFIFGILCLPVLYLVGARLYSPLVALGAVALWTCSPLAIEYGTLARGYSIFIFASLLLAYLANHIIEQPNRASLLFGFSIIATVGAFTIPLFLFPLAGTTLWICLSQFRRARPIGTFAKGLLGALTATAVFSALLYLPALLARGPGALFRNEYVASKGLSYYFAEAPGSFYWNWESWNTWLPTPVTYVLLVCVIISTVVELLGAPRRVPLLLVLTIVAIGITALMTVVPYRRTWLYLQPLYYLAAIDGLLLGIRRFTPTRLIRGESACLAVLLILVAWQCRSIHREFGGSFHTEQGTLRDAAEITEWLRPQLQPGDLILTLPPADSPMRYYFLRAGEDLNFLDPTGPKARRLFAIHNLEPNFSKSGVAIYQTLAELLIQNGYSSVEPTTAVTRKQFPFASVYVYTVSQN